MATYHSIGLEENIVKPYCVTRMTQLVVVKIKLILATGTIPMAVLSKATRSTKNRVVVSQGGEEHQLYASTALRTIIILRGGVFAVRYVMQMEIIPDYM
jgi:hypothetical protein